MEIRFEISPMYGPIDRDPEEALQRLLKKASARYHPSTIDHSIECESERDGLYHITMIGPIHFLLPVFTALYRFFYWHNDEDPIMSQRFTRIIFTN